MGTLRHHTKIIHYYSKSTALSNVVNTTLFCWFSFGSNISTPIFRMEGFIIANFPNRAVHNETKRNDILKFSTSTLLEMNLFFTNVFYFCSGHHSVNHSIDQCIVSTAHQYGIGNLEIFTCESFKQMANE